MRCVLCLIVVFVLSRRDLSHSEDDQPNGDSLANAKGLKEALEDSDGNPFHKGEKEAHFQERFATQQRLAQLREARKRAEAQEDLMQDMANDMQESEEKPNV